MAVEQLAADYAGQPVLLLEHDVDNPVGSRYGRWWAAYGSGSVTLPMIMVGSGHQITNGYLDFETVYSQMIDAELARPPEATVTARYRREGDQLHFEVTVTNQSGVGLGWENSGTVGVIVYEETQVALTGRFVRDNVSQLLTTSLNAGDSATYTLTSASLTGVDWDQIRAVAYVEYRPAGSQAYDMLQAAVPVQATLQTAPDSVVVMVPTGATASVTRTLALTGAGWETWTINAGTLPSWLALSQTSGAAGVDPVLTFYPGQMAAGWSATSLPVSVTGPGVSLETAVPVKAYLGRRLQDASAGRCAVTLTNGACFRRLLRFLKQVGIEAGHLRTDRPQPPGVGLVVGSVR